MVAAGLLGPAVVPMVAAAAAEVFVMVVAPWTPYKVGVEVGVGVVLEA